MKPSEYFARNFWIGASFLRPSEAPLCRELGIDHVMWGADYPHTEGSYPYTTEALRVAFADYPEPDVRCHGRVERRRASTGSTSRRSARSGIASARVWPTWPRRCPGTTGRPRPPATHSTPRRSCGRGEQRGGAHGDRALRRPHRASEPRDRGQEGARHLVRGGDGRVRDRPRDPGRGAAAPARARRPPARAHHHHPRRDAGAARSSARAGSACRPATRIASASTRSSCP